MKDYVDKSRPTPCFPDSHGVLGIVTLITETSVKINPTESTGTEAKDKKFISSKTRIIDTTSIFDRLV